MIEQSSMQTRMNEKAQLLLKELNQITPLNLMQLTNASKVIHSSFMSLWFDHSHQAARYMLLPYLYDRRIEFVNEHS